MARLCLGASFESCSLSFSVRGSAFFSGAFSLCVVRHCSGFFFDTMASEAGRRLEFLFLAFCFRSVLAFLSESGQTDGNLQDGVCEGALSAFGPCRCAVFVSSHLWRAFFPCYCYCFCFFVSGICMEFVEYRVKGKISWCTKRLKKQLGAKEGTAGLDLSGLDWTCRGDMKGESLSGLFFSPYQECLIIVVLLSWLRGLSRE